MNCNDNLHIYKENEILSDDGIISDEDIKLFEEVFRNKLIIVENSNKKANNSKNINIKSNDSKLILIKVDTFCNQTNIKKNNRIYYISMLISLHSIKILLRRGYYITNKYFIIFNNVSGKIHIVYNNKYKNTLPQGPQEI